MGLRFRNLTHPTGPKKGVIFVEKMIKHGTVQYCARLASYKPCRMVLYLEIAVVSGGGVRDLSRMIMSMHFEGITNLI